ncbi:MAG: aminotransferase class V-fold PLP-dependent enzyme, partial [Pedobacter sp.]
MENKLINEFGPFVANTHTETTVSGTAMTMAYHQARKIIKKHVNANAEDILINDGTGMTGVVNKFQRILGLKVPENLKNCFEIPAEKRPIVFISHMEHHSNQTTWLETIADVIVVPACEKGLFCLDTFASLLEEYKERNVKIASVTACSNVTGIKTPYHEIAKLMHQNNGVCFVDFACSGPYVKIDMHPEDSEAYLDAIFLSPHKFLGGPGTSGVLIFNKKLYKNMVPDNPGGGTVSWTNPWGEHKYLDNIEDREDGGTPGFLQVIKTALAIQLKEEMGVENILKREHEIVDLVFNQLKPISNLNILAGEHQDRLGVISFYIDDLHFNLGVKILNDRFGIQTRGGCSCAGTYGHYLLHVDEEKSHELTSKIDSGDLILKPGWIRMSIHPT